MRKKNSRLNQKVFIYIVGILLFFISSIAMANIRQHCKKASSPIIKMICAPSFHGDTKLLGLDYKASLIYEFSLFSTKNSAKLKKKQRLWLKERDSCQDINCMMESTQNRMRELIAIVDGHPNKPANPENGDLKGLWTDGDKKAYGSILITDHVIIWGGSQSWRKTYCKTTYSIEKEPFGTTFVDGILVPTTYVLSEKSQFKTYKLKLKPRKCLSDLAFTDLRFTLPYKIPNYADIIEYNRDDIYPAYTHFYKFPNQP
jgi:uncharacterized protein